MLNEFIVNDKIIDQSYFGWIKNIDELGELGNMMTLYKFLKVSVGLFVKQIGGDV